MTSKIYTYGHQNIRWSDVISVARALVSPWLTQGPRVAELEQAICQYTGAKYAVVVANGTASLHLAMQALELGPGQEVITSAMTFLASSNCALYVGAKPQFCDIDPATSLMDLEDLQKKITPQTKAIIPVHFAGQSCDMAKIAEIAKAHKLFIVEDAAHAIGSEYRGEKVGNCRYSDMTIFSFHPVKTITTGEGGAITTNQKELYEKLLALRSHGIMRDPNILTKNDGPWYYEMHYLGFNYRLTDIQAALGLSQLKKLDSFVKSRREMVLFYQDLFRGQDRFRFIEEQEYSKAAFHLCPLFIDFQKIKITKRELFEQLKARHILLQVHYIPVPCQPYYQKLGQEPKNFPNALAHYESELSLPLYPGLKDRDLRYIAKTIQDLAR